jgi:hypothetical protein
MWFHGSWWLSFDDLLACATNQGRVRSDILPGFELDLEVLG